jgi:septal ring factor EnvC (AmiA/AmiB activator)
MVRELEAAQKELNVLIEQLEQRRVKARTEYERGLTVKIEEHKGKLPWPVSGEIVKGFGKIVHPVYKTVTVNNGIDISAGKGETVQCVAPGRVVYIGRMRGLGKFIVVDHSGGYLTIYGHLDAVRVVLEQSVDFGTELGTVGESGSLSGAKLHFEVRKSTASLDPTEWLE